MRESVVLTDSVIATFRVLTGDDPYAKARGVFLEGVIRTCQSAGRKDRDGRIDASVTVASDTVIDPPIVRGNVCVARVSLAYRA